MGDGDPDTGPGTREATALAGRRADGDLPPAKVPVSRGTGPIAARRSPGLKGGGTDPPPAGGPGARGRSGARGGDRHPPADPAAPRGGPGGRPARPNPLGMAATPAPPAFTHRRSDTAAAATPGPGATAAWRRPLPCRAASSRGAGPPRRPPGSAPRRRRARPPPGPALHPGARRRLLPPPLPAAPGAGKRRGWEGGCVWGGGVRTACRVRRRSGRGRGGAQPVICT